MVNITEMGQALQRVFGQTAEYVARAVGFVQRTSKLSGSQFLLVWVLGFLQHPKASLDTLCQVATDVGVEITKQGMQQRLTSAAVTFLEQMFEQSKEALRSRIGLPLALLKQFAAVHLVDSSAITLPDSLAAEFPAAGGDGPRAGLKLQAIWEFLRGNLEEIIRQTGCQPDQRFRDHLAYIAPGVLFLCDLGYFTFHNLGRIAAGAAFFVSRLDTQCGLYERGSGERFDLLAHLNWLSKDHEELELLVGCEARLPCRVLAVRMPPEVVAERRRQAQRKARRKHRRLTPQKLAWLAWNVYITNVPMAMLSFAQVVLMYRLRWQIELLFRLWKSKGHLARIAGRRRERILCEIYAKLIGMLVFHYLTAPVRWAERELSPVKALQTLQRHAKALAKAIHSLSDLCAELSELVRRWERFALKDKRRSRVSTCSLLAEAA